MDFMKLIFMAEDSRIKEIRPAAEALFEGRASLTRALPGMLEVSLWAWEQGAAVHLCLACLAFSCGL